MANKCLTKGLCLFSKTAKFLNLAFKIDKLKTKNKNSALY